MEHLMKKLLLFVVVLIFPSAAIANSFTTLNSLVNPGFETGDFSGWTVSGTSPNYGVAVAGTPISGVNPVFQPTAVLSHSGVYAAWGLVAEAIPNTLVLSQSIYVQESATAGAGFYIGNGGSATWGTSIGDSGACNVSPCNPLGGIFIYANGQPFIPNGGPHGVIVTPGEYILVSGQLNLSPGWNDIAFQITGSGTDLAGASADDFFVNVPEPPSLTLVLSGLIGLIGVRLIDSRAKQRRRSNGVAISLLDNR
jgi:hypothetical protein